MIRAALALANLAGSQVGHLLRVKGRTSRKWTGGDQSIPWSAWRLLAMSVGLVDAFDLIIKNLADSEIDADERETFEYLSKRARSGNSDGATMGIQPRYTHRKGIRRRPESWRPARIWVPPILPAQIHYARSAMRRRCHRGGAHLGATFFLGIQSWQRLSTDDGLRGASVSSEGL